MTLTERKEVVESKMDDRGCFTPVWTFKSLSLCFRKNQSQSSCATAFQLPEFYFSPAPCSFLRSHFSVSSLWALMICLSKHTWQTSLGYYNVLPFFLPPTAPSCLWFSMGISFYCWQHEVFRKFFNSLKISEQHFSSTFVCMTFREVNQLS